LEPVGITKDGGEPIVLYGRQRVKAARQANIKLLEQGIDPLKVPCVVKKGDEADLFSLTCSENENRKDDSILAKAKKVQRLYNMGKGKKDAAQIFGVSVQAVSNWEKILDLSGKCQRAIENGQITASAAAKLSDLPRKEQDEKLDELLTESKGKRPTGSKAASKATGEKKPKSRTYNQIRKVMESDEYDIPPDAWETLKWVIGESYQKDEVPNEWVDDSTEDSDLDLD
jgi:ParB family chromosome partitioning protein